VQPPSDANARFGRKRASEGGHVGSAPAARGTVPPCNRRQRRTSAEPVLDHEAEVGRSVYTLTNPQKADLVDRIEDCRG